ncbi:hydroxyacylglutathione hydrolase [Xanthobacter dioxanivorans]|uniref:Hydroxyacylglutathione hydrolase n=1 Tax=Xanthobacter dioxanivorans TaxID=2528964 RepID=A0A974PR51_9HYPH|nr:hydroxyacylglutathione hydrolase [Xanthobacter dioxanivorans]QRG08262.1 hydroxyacylglutathione hydrolase [Xanthobacter dioxanivorans]
MPAEIRLVPCLSDNYAVLLHDRVTEATAVIDVPEATPVIAALEAEGWNLTHILVTHHHADHVQGIPAVKARYGATVVGPKAEAAGIPGLDVAVVDGDPVAVGSLIGRVLETPGHTAGPASYLFEGEGLLFAGDTLFTLGCGRPLECEPPVLWASLQRLRALPETLAVYSGHEYTLANARFALSVDPDNPLLARLMAEAEAKRAAGQPTIPSRLGEECGANPFLRADDPAMAERLGLAGADPAAVFTELRARKNVFRG